MDTRKEQILSFNQESSLNDKSLIFKIYNYFYLIIKSKKEMNSLIISLLIILETIQFISYAFTEPHLDTWKINKKSLKIISIILGSIRISPLMIYVTFNNYLIVSYCLLGVIFIFYIFILFQILSNSPLTRQIGGVSFIKNAMNIISIFLYIPITELFLLPLKCKDGKIEITVDTSNCGSGFYYIYIVIGIIGAILLFFLILFFLNFYFFPFYDSNSNRKLTTSNDIFLHIFKLIYILRYIFIKDEYFSIAILLICSMFCVIQEFFEKTYNIQLLKIVVNIRNICTFWTYFILFLSKICYNSRINGIIYLLFFSYPLIIYISILKIKRAEIEHFLIPVDINDINYLIKKSRVLMKMVESEIEENNTLNKSNNKKKKKSEIFLYGYIKMHVKTCVFEECPLKKYLQNTGNYNFQKQCLLSYMSIHFNNIIKNFPKNTLIRIYYIHFNYTKRYNLNSVRTNLAELKKLKVNFQEEFIIFCMEQDIKEIDSKVSDIGLNGDTFDLELIDQKYLKLKYLIENTTKLYVEFWSIFSGNITNLNTNKLNILGTKLNNYLNEINNIWEKDLKNINIDLEHQGIVLLYSKFLKEILWNNKKSEEISKKVSNSQYFRHDTQKVKSGKKSKIPNIDSVIENQDYLLFANSNEKGICKIVQCSYNILYFLGYEKKDLIRKQIEILMPSIFVEGHKKMLETRIKKMINSQSSILDSSLNSTKKHNFILLRNKVGYLIPMNSNFTIYDDSDYSNTYIIKGKMEPKDSKSVYAYYILTRPDFVIDSISSSALNLGLSMDLLKKYLVKMNILVRSKDDDSINFFERYQEFEDEPKQIIWVYPHVIYPKDNNNQRNKEIIIQDLINHSPKGRFYLQVNKFQYSKDKIIGFSFKITEIYNKKEKNNINYDNYIPKTKQEVMFDLLNLNYIRTILVKQKTGLRNLREQNDENESNKKSTLSNKKKNKKSKKEGANGSDEESSEEENKKEVALTKEKILELQASDSNYIKNFIFSLPFNGNDVSLEKHRPNKEKYPAGKTTEPRIKIEVSNFIKRVEEKILSDPKMLKKLKKSKNASVKFNSNIESNEYLSSPLSPKEETNKEEIGREISDVSSVLSKLFDDYAIHLFIFVSFCIYAYIIVLSLIEFSLTYKQMNKVENSLSFFQKGAELMNIMLYTKYFLTEAVIANKLNETDIKYIGQEDLDLDNFNKLIINELSFYHQKFREIYNSFTSNSEIFSKEYKNFMQNTSIEFYSLANDIPVNETKLFSASLNKILTSLFYISTVQDEDNILKMEMRNTYELMFNILNGYLNKWKNVTLILGSDVEKSTKNIIFTLIILILTFVLGIISVYIYYRVLYNVSVNAEKPINLILTIKKKIFEDLKNSAESFANKLLNKFFGNEENEEESQQDYQKNIQSNDINIVKFKSPSNASYSCISFLIKILQIILFLGIVEIYFVFKYIYSMNNFDNMNKFFKVYNTTEYTDSDIITTIDIVKSFLYNNSIPIYETDSIEPFINIFYDISDYIEKTVIETSKTESFLRGQYRKNFINYLYDDFSELIKDDIDIEQFKDDIGNGFRPILSEIYEIIKYIEFLYLSNETYYNNNRIENTTCILINNENWVKLNTIVKNLLRNFFTDVEIIMYNLFENYMRKARVVNTIIFVILQCFLLFYFIIIWRRYYITVKVMVKKSQELINLIPEEIKYIMVEKINE